MKSWIRPTKIVVLWLTLVSTTFALPYEINFPTSHVYVRSNMGSGTKPADVDVQYELWNPATNTSVTKKTYSDPYEGWGVSLSYSVPANAQYQMRLLDAGGVVKDSVNVTTGYMEQ